MPRPPRPGWCTFLPPATTTVACGGEEHRVTWRRGKVVLEDHDLSAERTMLAFGGQPCECLKTLNRWREMHSGRIPAQVIRRMQSGPDRHLLLAPPGLAGVTELTLALTWEREWHRSRRTSDHGDLLEEVLARRARPALSEHVTAWRVRTGSRLLSGVEVRLAPPGSPPSLTGTIDAVAARAVTALRASWLGRVWARGLATVDDAFVLDVGRAADEHAVPVLAARWEERRPGHWTPAVGEAWAARDRGGGWHLTGP